jgi:vanillate O-demethylase monooxygenase subunit
LAIDREAARACEAAYLLNTWYVAAWASELGLGAHMQRVLLGRPVMLARSANGDVAAIGNVCPHRFASLSKGRFEGGVVECPYHGLRFDMRGRCVSNPHGDGKIPDRARVPSYPVVERYGAIWIWFGDPIAADAASIPDFSFLESPTQNARGSGYLVTKANYQLLCDNILDLSHADFLHRTTLGAEGDIARSQPHADLDGDVVTIKWSFDGKGMVMGRSAPNPPDVRTEFEVTWHPPGAMSLRSSAYEISGEALQLDERRGHQRVAAHIMTPETECSTHYFFNVSDGRTIDLVTQMFEAEDGVMLETVQENMGGEEFWNRRPLILSSDGGGVLARRVLQKKMRQEKEEHQAKRSPER